MLVRNSSEVSEGGRREPPSDELLDALLWQALRSEWDAERQSIEEALVLQDLELLRRRLHRLQGALMALGADDLLAELQVVQELCPSADWAVLSARCRQLLLHVEQSLR
ncbi:Hpt domain-containing protein [Xanthomonas sacchari]|uniref:Hpt domain-containing protein n=1 Tax=Xanthomonas sacchari TaxID=56458 RepID=A0AA46SYJ1_9XANT|nr:Hpt domain-containing protein [Xanthomonas sacchari]UYK90877.1 Hpt domain-containing protein [Xanthomonas sacchari]